MHEAGLVLGHGSNVAPRRQHCLSEGGPVAGGGLEQGDNLRYLRRRVRQVADLTEALTG
jgi:hypothetical protein